MKSILFVSDLKKAIDDLEKLGYDLSKTPVKVDKLPEGSYRSHLEVAQSAKFVAEQGQSLVVI